MATIYRATDSGYTGPWSCWATDYETAEEYTDNPGFGGSDIIERDVDLSRVLDLRHDRTGVDYRALAAALGYEDPQATADDWRIARGWQYPWEESGDIARRIEALDIDWIRYLDDYPLDADTLVSVRGV